MLCMEKWLEIFIIGKKVFQIFVELKENLKVAKN